ncbi:unnamed protein product [Polarella glacialis]|uniref:Uncharacterized protein n=1 Tax=Polarella glacialis TaxID=89957 RepID=A0A813GUX4_POLGL|nr:unnamed protein product [Polarella glacialis]
MPMPPVGQKTTLRLARSFPLRIGKGCQTKGVQPLGAFWLCPKLSGLKFDPTSHSFCHLLLKTDPESTSSEQESAEVWFANLDCGQGTSSLSGLALPDIQGDQRPSQLWQDAHALVVVAVVVAVVVGGGNSAERDEVCLADRRLQLKRSGGCKSGGARKNSSKENPSYDC